MIYKYTFLPVLRRNFFWSQIIHEFDETNISSEQSEVTGPDELTDLVQYSIKLFAGYIANIQIFCISDIQVKKYILGVFLCCMSGIQRSKPEVLRKSWKRSRVERS